MRFFSEIFIRRPIATVLLSLSFIIAGLFGVTQLPVSPLPQLDIPVIFISASIPGADAETMAATVATPLERSLGRIAGVTDITSSSSQGNSRVILQFDMSRDINGAARDVQAAINASRSMLPTTLRSNPVYRKVNPADIPVMILAITSDVLTTGQLYDLASTTVAQRLSQLPGVGDVSINGSSLPAVRVSINPDILAKQGISMTAVGEAINNANRVRPKGGLAHDNTSWLLDLNDKGLNASDFAPLVINYADGASVRLQDIAKVYDSVENPRNLGRAGNQAAVSLVITRSPNANIIETVDRIKEAIPSINEKLPATANLQVMLDRSPSIRASVQEVQYSLLISVALVIFVVYLFLGNARATLIPAVTIPISLVGTFFLMYLMGFSLNNLSLMALTIATGFVVDDAIVVLENAARHIESGMSVMDAALRSAQEVGFTVLSMSLSLVAVFAPFLFMGDLVGRLFLEFSATLTTAILLSLLVSLTTTPMMCAYLLSPHKQQERPNSWMVRRFHQGLAWVQRLYAQTLSVGLRHTRLVILSIPISIGLMVYIFIQLPKSFLPTQDMGAIQAAMRIDQSSSFVSLQEKFNTYMDVMLADPDVATVLGTAGSSSFGSSNSAQFYLTLKDHRQSGVMDVIARLRKNITNLDTGQVFFVPIQDIPGRGGRSANAENQYTLKSDSLALLREWEPKLRVAMAKAAEFVDVDSDLEGKGIETHLVYERDLMSRYGLTVADVNRMLYSSFGQGSVSTIYADRNQYKVVLEIDPSWVQNPTVLDKLVFINQRGESVPLSAFAHWASANTPASVNHHSQFASVTIAYNLADGVSLDQAIKKIEFLMTQIGMPSDIMGSSEGTTKTFQQGQSQQFVILFSAIVGMYLILGILYESYIHPVTILSTLPSAGLGALMALWVFKLDFSLVGMISILLLIGLVKKNAIMMIDFALDAQRRLGMSPREAIYQACLQRFRPILMTTMAAMLGAVPLALGTGAGSELRQPLGVAIVGGLLVSQLLTLYTTPVIYLYLDRFGRWFRDLISINQRERQ